MYCICVGSCQIDPCMYYFFFNDTATTEIYTLSLHDALPIYDDDGDGGEGDDVGESDCDGY